MLWVCYIRCVPVGRDHTGILSYEPLLKFIPPCTTSYLGDRRYLQRYSKIEAQISSFLLIIIRKVKSIICFSDDGVTGIRVDNR